MAVKNIVLVLVLAVAARTAFGQASAPSSGAAAAPTTSGSPLSSVTMSNGTLPAGFGQIQAQLRAEVNSSDFVNNLNSSGQGYTNSQYGSVAFVLGQNSPALATLPNAGLAQGVINLGACALWSPHLHPRANEILYVSQGTLEIAFQEENPTNTSTGVVGGRFLPFTVPAGSSIVIPQGLMHYASNTGCDTARIVTSFDNKDPGVVTIAQQFFNLPVAIISAATGLFQDSINIVRNQVSQTPIITVDAACLVRCSSTPTTSIG